jgi:predicted DNA-binding protein with PD1-like motif
MKSRLLIDGPEKTWALILSTGDEAASALEKFANENKLRGSHFSAIGAFVRATLGYFDWDKKDYVKIRIEEQVEVLSLLGDIAIDNGKPKIHAHVVVGRRDGAACGGHLLEGVVRPTLEIIVSESPEPLRKKYDPESHLALISV